nr:hypothetical protein [Tanacetum cinerariifolium]
MLNKENYVPWSSCLLWYAKSRPNGKLIHNSIINGPYVRRMIPELGDPNREVPVNEIFHVQTDDELIEKELKQIKADDQAIRTILLGLPEDIYATVDSCETAREIWLRVQQMMKGSNIEIQEKKAKLFNEWERFTSTDGESIECYYHRFLKLMNDLKRNKHFPEKIASNLKFLNNLQPEWSRHVTIVHQTKELHTADYTQLYDFLKYNQKENYMQQPMPNPEDITDPTAAINIALALMAKAFKLNYSTPTNNNQRISSNLQNMQIAQPGMNMGQDRQMQMVGGNGENQVRQYAGQNVGNLNGYNDVQNVRNQNLNGNGNLVAARAKGADLNKIEKVNANYILMANLQQALTSSTQTDKAPVYDLDGSAEYTELLKPIPESHQVPHNENNINSEVTSVEQSGGTVEQHSRNVEETRALYDSLYHNLVIEVEKVNTVNRKLKETNAELTTELARFKNQEKCFEISQEKYDKLERCYQKSVYQEQCLSKKINALQVLKKQQSLYDGKVLLEKHDPPVVHDSEETLQLAQESHQKMKQLNKEIKPANYTKINHLSGVLFSQMAKSKAAKFVGDFKYFAKEADESLAKHKALELEIERLLRAIFLGTVRFENDHVVAILGFGDLQWGNILITRVYFVERLGHNLFSIGQFCDLDLDVAFKRNSCFVRNLKGVDLLSGNRITNLYTINLHDMASASPICFMSCASSTKKLDISFLHVFGALCYPKNDRKDIGKLGVKGDIGFFIGYSADSCAYRIYNRRTNKIMETMNVSFYELLAMAFEQRSSKPELQSMTSGQISSGLDLTYAPSTITTQQPTEGELDLLFKAMYDDYIGGQPSATPRTDSAAQVHQVQNSFVNPFATSSTSAESSSSQYVDPSNMHTFYQPYPHEFQWTKDHPLEQVIGEPSQPVLIRNQLRTDGDMCMYTLSMSTMEPKNVKEAMTDPAWIESMQEELLQFKRMDVWPLVPALDNISPLTLKWIFKNKNDEKNTYQAKPTKKYLKEVKRIFCYLQGTINTGLWYMKDSGFELTGFSDANYAGYKDTFKSTFGGAQFLGEKLVSWSSKKQDCTVL